SRLLIRAGRGVRLPPRLCLDQVGGARCPSRLRHRITEMSTAVRGILDTFEHLSGDEQREVAAEVLRRTRDMEYPPLDEETLARIADETFLEYDVREAADVGREQGGSLAD